MTEDAKIPKQDLLAKLLKMTSSSNDGEALTAIRKANELLKSAGWDWDKLIAGKIRVAADPFSNLGKPYNPGNGDRAPPPAPSRPQAPQPTAAPWPRANPQPQPKPAPQPQPRPQPQPSKPFEPFSHRSTNGQTNLYPGNCYVCGHSVSAKAGKLFVPEQFNHAATQKKMVICDTCDKDKYSFIDSRPAPQPKAPHTGTPNLGDL